MIDPAIQDFFQKRKEDWLKKKIKQRMTDDEKRACEDESDEKFSLENWLPDAARRAGQISLSSHPCTFSHPSARKNKNGYVTPIRARAKRLSDGFLKTANVEVEYDALGNAAALDVYKFLSLVMKDGETLIKHIGADTKIAKGLLTINSESYGKLKNGFMAMASNDTEFVTSSKIKQVYFPVKDGDYHLLSILSNSGLIFELRNRVDLLRFSDQQKDLREKKRKNEYSEKGFSEIFNLTTIGYGGTKPQNISVLNNQYGGRARLLLSIPPHLENRSVNFPKKDFFTSSIRYFDIKEPLKKLHGIFKTGLGTEIPRRNLESGRDHRIEEIIDTIIERMATLRSVSRIQYREENSHLPLYQKIWLCDNYEKERIGQQEWLDTLTEKIFKWIINAYTSRKIIKQPVVLGPAERNYIKEFINRNREALR